MNTSTLISSLGGGSAIARRLGISRQAVSRWRATGLPQSITKRLELRDLLREIDMSAEDRAAGEQLLLGASDE